MKNTLEYNVISEHLLGALWTLSILEVSKSLEKIDTLSTERNEQTAAAEHPTPSDLAVIRNFPILGESGRGFTLLPSSVIFLV